MTGEIKAHTMASAIRNDTMNAKHRACTIAAMALSLCVAASAQSSAEFNQKLGACSALKDRMKRATCFESLSKEAVAEIDRLALAAAGAKGGTAAPPAQAPQSPKSQYADFIIKAKSNIANAMKDPSSVQFRNLFVSDSGMLALCGEVNAKNAYGAYVGFRRFFATKSADLQIVGEEKSSYVIDGMWPSMCSSLKEIVD